MWRRSTKPQTFSHVISAYCIRTFGQVQLESSNEIKISNLTTMLRMLAYYWLPGGELVVLVDLTTWVWKEQGKHPVLQVTMMIKSIPMHLRLSMEEISRIQRKPSH